MLMHVSENELLLTVNHTLYHLLHDHQLRKYIDNLYNYRYI